MKKLICLAVIIMCAGMLQLTYSQTDVEGSEDHKIISRYPSSVIGWYDTQEFDRYKIAIGPVTGYRHIDDWLTVEGKVTRIFYTLSGSRSSNEVYQNYSAAMKKNGFEILADGMYSTSNRKKDFGGRGWLEVYFGENPLPAEVPLLTGSSTSGGSAFIAGKLTKNNATVYVAVTISQYSSETVYYLIDIIEEDTVEDDFIFVNADIMKNEIDANGKIALYGIYFDTDKATLKPESDPTFKEISALLKNRPGLELYVVGHTDMTGSLDHNMSLSDARAKSVVNELTKKYRINPSRLTAKGVGPLSPVSTNTSESGRKLNRRVELVAK